MYLSKILIWCCLDPIKKIGIGFQSLTGLGKVYLDIISLFQKWLEKP